MSGSIPDSAIAYFPNGGVLTSPNLNNPTATLKTAINQHLSGAAYRHGAGELDDPSLDDALNPTTPGAGGTDIHTRLLQAITYISRVAGSTGNWTQRYAAIIPGTNDLATLASVYANRTSAPTPGALAQRGATYADINFGPTYVAAAAGVGWGLRAVGRANAAATDPIFDVYTNAAGVAAFAVTSDKRTTLGGALVPGGGIEGGTAGVVMTATAPGPSLLRLVGIVGQTGNYLDILDSAGNGVVSIAPSKAAVFYGPTVTASRFVGVLQGNADSATTATNAGTATTANAVAGATAGAGAANVANAGKVIVFDSTGGIAATSATTASSVGATTAAQVAAAVSATTNTLTGVNPAGGAGFAGRLLATDGNGAFAATTAGTAGTAGTATVANGLAAAAVATSTAAPVPANANKVVVFDGGGGLVATSATTANAVAGATAGVGAANIANAGKVVVFDSTGGIAATTATAVMAAGVSTAALVDGAVTGGTGAGAKIAARTVTLANIADGAVTAQATPNMTVQVAPYWYQNSTSVYGSASGVSPVYPALPVSGQSRYDLLYAADNFALGWKQGVAAASNPTQPTSDALTRSLAWVLVTSGTTAITQAMIVDARPSPTSGGGPGGSGGGGVDLTTKPFVTIGTDGTLTNETDIFTLADGSIAAGGALVNGKDPGLWRVAPALIRDEVSGPSLSDLLPNSLPSDIISRIAQSGANQITLSAGTNATGVNSPLALRVNGRTRRITSLLTATAIGLSGPRYVVADLPSTGTAFTLVSPMPSTNVGLGPYQVECGVLWWDGSNIQGIAIDVADVINVPSTSVTVANYAAQNNGSDGVAPAAFGSATKPPAMGSVTFPVPVPSVALIMHNAGGFVVNVQQNDCFFVEIALGQNGATPTPIAQSSSRILFGVTPYGTAAYNAQVLDRKSNFAWVSLAPGMWTMTQTVYYSGGAAGGITGCGFTMTGREVRALVFKG